MAMAVWWRSFGVLVAAVTLLGGVLATTPAAGVAGFGDVPGDVFYTDAVQWMVDNDITTGTSFSCFSPDDPVTRGQASAFMWRMEGEPGAPAHPFVDVVAAWQQGPVSWMVAEGITTGTSPTTYSPDDVLTRGQLAALLWRLAGGSDLAPATPHPFLDVVSGWQQEPVSWLAESGITTGTSPTTFSPDDTVTRGQLATFFHRYKGSPAVTVDAASPACPAPPNPGDPFDCPDFPNQAAAQAWFDTHFPFYGDVADLDRDNDGMACEENPGNVVSCGSFATQAQAQAWFDFYFPSFGDVAKLDGDNDGVACESLP